MSNLGKCPVECTVGRDTPQNQQDDSCSRRLQFFFAQFRLLLFQRCHFVVWNDTHRQPDPYNIETAGRLPEGTHMAQESVKPFGRFKSVRLLIQINVRDLQVAFAKESVVINLLVI